VFNVRASSIQINSEGELEIPSGQTGRLVFWNNTRLIIDDGMLTVAGASVFTSSAPGSVRYGVEVNGGIDVRAACQFDSLNANGLLLGPRSQPTALDGLIFSTGALGGIALNFDPVTVVEMTISSTSFDSTISTNVRARVDPTIQPTTDLYLVLSTGSHTGPLYENDPAGVIHWGKLGTPTNFTGTALGVSSITWSWDITNFPLAFYVISSTGGTVSPPLFADARSWTETQLSANVPYTRRVRAITDTGQAESGTHTTYTEAAAPLALNFLGVHVTSVTFAWNDNGNAADTTYQIDRSSDKVGYFQLARGVYSSLSPYSDTGLIPETSYYYRVSAENGAGNLGSGVVVIGTTTRPVPPPRIISVIPSTAPNLGLISLTVTGNYIQAGATLRLKRLGSTAINAQEVVVVNSDLMQAQVPLTGTLFGAWDVEIQNPDTKVSLGTGAGALNVENATSAGDVTIGTYGGSALTLLSADGQTQLFISASAFVPARIYISGNPLNTPLSVSPSLIESATAAMNEWIFVPGTVREILAFTSQGAFTSGFSKPVNLTIGFPDENRDGIIDSVTVRRATLRMMTLNEITGRWELLEEGTIDIANNRVTAPLSHFSVYALFGSPAAPNLSEAKVYPSPWKPGSGGPFDADHLTFSELTDAGEIRIYNAAAKFIKAFHYNTNQAGIAAWDGRDEGGAELKSGMYLIYIKSDTGETAKLKLGVER
jgi:hypothetical protein